MQQLDDLLLLTLPIPRIFTLGLILLKLGRNSRRGLPLVNHLH
jgi:hypothetical protein